jgi:CubicO group peptidase (beta-lactamase class C family)
MKERPKFQSLVFVLSLLGSLPAGLLHGEEPAQPNAAKAGLSHERLAAVDNFMETAVADGRIAGGSVAVSRRGTTGFLNTYGSMDLETQKPMTQDTIFLIFSMSKAITTAAALTLYEDGKLDLDDPVGDYLPSLRRLQVATAEGLRDPLRPVTIRDLMLHTAGMTYGGLGPQAHQEAFAKFKPLEAGDLQEMVERLAEIPLANDPGEKWSYGVSVDVLGRVAEVVSGQPLDQFLKETIFDPLDMRDTAFHVPDSKRDRFAVTYTPSSNGLERVVSPHGISAIAPVGLMSGGGGLVSTIGDYLRFLKMVEQGGKLEGTRILRRSTVRLMTRNQLPEDLVPIGFGEDKHEGIGFGLGFAVRVEESASDASAPRGEYGWGGAASTHYWISPSDRLIVVTMEQIVPYHQDTKTELKPIIYEAIGK